RSLRERRQIGAFLQPVIPAAPDLPHRQRSLTRVPYRRLPPSSAINPIRNTSPLSDPPAVIFGRFLKVANVAGAADRIDTSRIAGCSGDAGSASSWQAAP